MASLVPGYNYDVFISYRQKDNRSDQWVTQFVQALRDELDSVFKEEISIYFDANPHDGLSETHDVDGSLREKIKAVVFLPIVSQTYCDPNAFAWKNEFLAFLDFARKDDIGLDVRLAGGNVAKRVLPVRIHDLESGDKNLFETALGGVMRPVDFIYRETGVNRPLRAKDDDVKEVTHALFYRDQINKVANGIKEILHAVQKKPAASAPEPAVTASTSRTTLLVPAVRRAAMTITVLVAVTFGGLWIYTLMTEPSQEELRAQTLSRLRLALETTTVKWGDTVNVSDLGTFRLAMAAREQLGDDPELKALWPLASHPLRVTTDPPGAEVRWRPYNAPDKEYVSLGKSPIQHADMPNDVTVIEISLPGYDTVWWVSSVEEEVQVRLDRTSPGRRMVRVPGNIAGLFIQGLDHNGGLVVPEFLIDRMEVTNREFKEFIDRGGYTRAEYWQYPIMHEGRSITLPEARKLFVDRTGRPGPATWEAGTFPDGEDEHPVSGVSWYEATAYAAFAGKSLPTVFHWSRSALTIFVSSDIIARSNFNGTGTVPAGSLLGFNHYGAVDLAGNVREWCLNASIDGKQRYVLGGAYNDAPYLYYEANRKGPMDRSDGNGFRCMSLLPGDTTLQTLGKPLSVIFRDYSKESPIDDKTFKLFLSHFEYDKGPLKAETERKLESTHFTVDRIALDPGYGKDRPLFYLFLPRSGPPYRTIIFWTGSNAIRASAFNPDEAYNFNFLLKSGYAVAYVVLRGMYERSDELTMSDHEPTVRYRQYATEWIKDIRRIMDYMDTREDIVNRKYGFFGYSWGGAMSPLVLATDDRVKASVIHVGGLRMRSTLPEVDPINFLPRVKVPFLMLNGSHDVVFPYEASQKPMFQWLGTPEDQKKLLQFKGGHLVPKPDLIRETLNWYDTYLRQ